jgi:hypothetical protein
VSNLRNPFLTLYVTERVNELDFPAIFSPTLLPLVLPLFQPGNVMLSGTQGTGKSMLLALLDTDIRLAFWGNTKNPFPLDGVESKLCRFVGANINLSTSLVLKFNERRFGDDDNTARCQAVFSDYFNTWVIRDLLQSLQRLIAEAPEARLRDCGVNTDAGSLNKAVKEIAATDECRGLTGEATTVDAAIARLSARLRVYLDFINFRTDEIPNDVWATITGIGEPISIVAKLLRATGVLSRNTEVFVTVDQCEELLRLEQRDSSERNYGRFLTVLDKLISSREKSVSYRLGTRPNAIWKGKSEEVRDYVRVDLDALFRKKEHARSIFPSFAEDVFRRRLIASGTDARQPDALQAFFGPCPTAQNRAKQCAPAKKPERVLGLEKAWPEQIISQLSRLANDDVLSAKLGEAWFRQNAATSDNLVELSEIASELPWEQSERKWWRKERTGQAILQIAAANAQRIPYYGKRDVLALAGHNILVFALICQKIWECWLQTVDVTSGMESEIPRPFSKWRQDEGIRVASNIWHSKLSTAPSGDTLRRFVDELGKRLRNQLRGDKPMSYPGANGISLSNKDLETDPEIKVLLDDATAEGFFQVFRHTPKTPSRGLSQKWYPHPILAPFYELTVAHTKEPLYVNISELRTWLEKSHVVERRATKGKSKRSVRPPGQKSLFDEEADE